MATLIPAIGACTFDTTGERRLAERLEQKSVDAELPSIMRVMDLQQEQAPTMATLVEPSENHMR